MFGPYISGASVGAKEHNCQQVSIKANCCEYLKPVGCKPSCNEHSGDQQQTEAGILRGSLNYL